MNDLLSDAVKTALDYSYKVKKLKRAVAVMGFVIIALIIALILK